MLEGAGELLVPKRLEPPGDGTSLSVVDGPQKKELLVGLDQEQVVRRRDGVPEELHLRLHLDRQNRWKSCSFELVSCCNGFLCCDPLTVP